MERVIPKLKNMLLHPLLGSRGDRGEVTEEKYLEKIQEFERNCEKSLIETFSKLGIKAVVKTDPYSLPYNNERMVRLMGESYLNGAYEFHRVARQIVKEVLQKDLWELRFYLFINVCEKPLFGCVEYRFRYHIKGDVTNTKDLTVTEIKL